MKNSAERIIPDEVAADEATGAHSLQLHIDRYHYAGKHLLSGKLADIACGVGYGSHILAREYGNRIEKIYAVDIDKSSIDFARQRYHHSLIHFIMSDVYAFQSPELLQSIISLETIEHLPRPEAFIRHMAKQLIKGGRFIASVPVTPSMDANPFHLHDFTKASFVKMFLDEGFRLVDSIIQPQPYNPFAIAGRKEARSQDLRKNIIRYYFRHPGKFLLRLKSLITDGFTNKYMVAVFEKL